MSGASKRQAFFASPFAEKYRWIRNAAAASCRILGIDLRAVDETVAPGGDIVTAIHYEIARCDLGIVVISDLNPNVMYELGMLKQASKPTVLLGDDATLRTLPFDLRTLMVIRYAADARDEVALTQTMSGALSRLLSALGRDVRAGIAGGETREAEIPQSPTAHIDASFSDIDFERLKQGAANATNRKGCKTKNISPYDEDNIKGWKLVAKCLGGDTITVVVDLNGSVVDIDVTA